MLQPSSRRVVLTVGLSMALWTALFACSTTNNVTNVVSEDGGGTGSDGSVQGDSSGPDSDAAIEASTDGGAPDADASMDADAFVPRYGVSVDSATTQRVETTFPIGLVGAGSATFEGWFRVQTLTDNAVLFTVYGMDASTANVVCSTAGASYPLAYQGKLSCLARLGCGTCNPAQQAWSTGAVPIGVWFHLAWVFGGAKFTMYIDGVSQSEATPDFVIMPTPQVGKPIQLGGSARAGETLSGIVDEFRVSSGARYTTNFVPPKHLDADATSLVALLLDEGAGTTSAGGAATLVNGAGWMSVSR